VSGTRALSLALCQLSGMPYDAERNRSQGLEAAERAFALGAGLVLLPELTVPGYGADATRMRELAEPLDGPTVTAWRRLAARHNGHIAGGFCERDGDSIFNAAVVVSADGVALHYRKLHLFGDEKDAFTPGDRGLPVADTALGRIGACVCYDLRFVETVRILALRGAELILVPTAWVPGFDREPSEQAAVAPQAQGVLLQANLSQVFIACASQAGTMGDVRFLGSSVVADPLGRAVSGPLPRDRDEIALARIDLDQARLAQDRGGRMTPRADRRTDLYALAVDGELL
jgi:predicted amidohydrolase